MIFDKITSELLRIKRKIGELDITSRWDTHIETSIKADKELQTIYNKLKEV